MTQYTQYVKITKCQFTEECWLSLPDTTCQKLTPKERAEALYKKYPDFCEEDGCGYDQVIDTENFNGTPREL